LLHFPNAKINIGLFVTEKRNDGFHNIETIFYPIPMLKDALEVLPMIDQNESSMRISGKAVEGSVTDNLVWKAFQLIKNKYPDKVSSISIHLLKSIPMGAGLGGGSADGAFMLRLLNKFFQLNLSDTILVQFALELGSDCPFFIYNTPQLAFGRGEILSPISLDLSQYSIQIICPKIHVSTKGAFDKIDPKSAPFDLRNLPNIAIEHWKDVVINDFEKPIFEFHPSLIAIKQKLYLDGALFASMSGSGSALYAIFEKGKCATFQNDNHHDVHYFE
jgi:4-diphosphocytidyl-2-C-methyl-D-erythritol kinase